MKLNLTSIFVFVLLQFTAIVYSQATINVFYGNPAITIANGGSVSFGLSGEIEFSVVNIPTSGNPSLSIQSITVSNSNFVVSSTPFISITNIKKGETGIFKIRKNSSSCTSGASVVTINSNLGSFSFTVSFNSTSLISVLGGMPTYVIPTGQLVPNSINGTMFGTVDISSSTTRNFVIANTGTCPLSLGALTCLTYNPQTGLPSSEFSIISIGSSSVVPGGTTYFVIQFSPQSTGLKSALITIPNSDISKPSYTFVVSGDGYDPTVSGPGGGNPDFRLWLKANRGINLTDGVKVPLWKDLGSLGKDASQSAVANQPTFVDSSIGNINYNPVVKFENNGAAISQYLYNVVNGFYTQESFIVMEPDGAIGGPMTIISGTSAANPYPVIPGEFTGIGLGNFTTRLSAEKLWFNQWDKATAAPYYSVADNVGDYTKAGIINVRNKTATVSDGIELMFDSNNVSILRSSDATYSNIGSLDTSITPNIWKGSPYNIGKNINSGDGLGDLNGRVAEVLSYASRVLDSNRPKIETYLAIKYGITLGVNGTSKNYINSAGGVIWDTAANTGFNYNIAGIGRDIASDLYQKQSKSGSDSYGVTIGLGVVASKNSDNINQFSVDRNFLTWGSDNGAYTAGSSNTITLRAGLSTPTTRINKKWKIVETGGDVENVYVSIPSVAFSAFTKSVTEEYVLIVSDNASFNDSDIIDVIPLKSDGNGNLQTWYDFDGTKYFTFGKTEKLESSGLVNFNAGGFLVGEYALNLNSGSFSIGCWLRNTSSGIRTIMSKGVNLELRLNASNKIEAYWDGVLKFVSNTAIVDGKWHNVVAVYHLGSANLYIDGVLDLSVFNLTNPAPNFSRYSVGALYVKKNDVRTPFYGEIDEVSIWDMALSANQINYLMNQEIAKFSNNTSNGIIIPQSIKKNELNTINWSTLKSYYNFNSFYGTTVEGLTDEHNYLRINYLNKNKQITAVQTAPLPYETVADGAWNDSSIWKNGDVQVLPNNVSIVDSQKQVTGNIVQIKHNVSSTGNKTLLALIVDGTDGVTFKTLTANNNTKIEVSHYLKLNGLIDLKGRSQLVQTLDSELDNSSIGFIKRDQQGTVNKYNYNYWSSPVGPINAANNANYIVKDVYKEGTNGTPQNINWIDGINGSLAPFSLSRYWLYKFENGSGYSNWVRFKENVGTRPSQAFIVKGAGSVDVTNTQTQNYTFVGKPYNGLINSNSVLANNLFLVGNPYPSAIDAFEFIKDNISVANGGKNTTDVIDGTLYFWQHSPTNATHALNDYTGGYATLTLTGATPPVAPEEIFNEGTSVKLPYQFIPVGQGFFVTGAATISGSAPVIFKNSQRAFVKEDGLDDLSLSISNTMFKMSSQKATHFNNNSNDVFYNDNEVTIRLGFNSSKKVHRQLLIGFLNENATDKFDRGYDGYQFDTKENDIYFLINKERFTIQGVGKFDVSKTYPLGVNINDAGLVKFMVDGTTFLPSNHKILLLDKNNNMYYDITNTSIEIDLPKGVYTSRFELAFKKEVVLGVEEVALNLVSNVFVSTNSIKKIVAITANEDVQIKEVTIYNILGQLLANLKQIENGTQAIEIPFNVPRGVYMVKVKTNKGIVEKKIIAD